MRVSAGWSNRNPGYTLFTDASAGKDRRRDRQRSDVPALDQRFSVSDIRFEALKAELVKWMFLFWTGSALANLLIRR
jgi:hypothetical protein